MNVPKKNKIAQFFCKHEYKHFETPIDYKNNPMAFVALNDNGIWMCVKCGKRSVNNNV